MLFADLSLMKGIRVGLAAIKYKSQPAKDIFEKGMLAEYQSLMYRH